MRRILLALTLSALAQAAPSYHQNFSIDLTGDGRKEQVVLQTYDVGGTRMGQLLVLGPKGRTLWAAPKVKDPYEDSPWAFLGEFDLGDIAWVGDYDGDGDVDLCATYQKSDVRPTEYRLFHWARDRFVFDRRGILIAQPQKPATYNWAPADPSLSSWVDSMKWVGPGQFQLKVSTIPEPSKTYKARYQAGEGFVVSGP